MAKGDTTKTILIIGGLALGAYIITRPSTQEKIQEIIAGGGFPSIQSIDFQMPDLAGLLDQLQQSVGGTCLPGIGLPGLPDLIGGLDEIFKPGGGAAGGPQEHATWADVAYNLPVWAKAIMGVGATALGGYGGYHIIRAFAPVLKATGQASATAITGGARVIARLLAPKVVVHGTGAVVKGGAPLVAGKIATGGILGGLLPGLAFAGITEGAYQLYRLIKGESNIGMTGVPPVDLINLITGKASMFGPEPPKTLMEGILGGGPVGASQGGTPATVVPSVVLKPSVVATQTTPEAIMLPELKFPSYTVAPAKVIKSPLEIVPGYGGHKSLM